MSSIYFNMKADDTLISEIRGNDNDIGIALISF